MTKLLNLTFAASTLCLCPTVAWAQGVDVFGPYGVDEETYQTPQHVAVELRFGPYYPNVDDEFEGTGQTPFRDHFGKDNRWLVGFEVDWQVLKIPHFGTLGPGAGFGFTKMTGQAFLDDGTVAETQTVLSILPMYLVGVLRVDTISKTTPVPVVPYAKAGLGYAMWWTNDGQEIPRAADGSPGNDTSYGFQWALGAMLLLDALEPRAAASMDAANGVNSSYFFIEWYNSNLNGFGSGNQMQVGTNTWMTGIALEM